MQLLQRLERLFECLEESLASCAGNPCGSCKACCTSLGVGVHRVSEIELSYIADRAGAARAEAFRRYAARERGPDGQLVFSTCPCYNEADARCDIHTYRPYSCRVFGHYRPDTHPLPDGCVFAGTETAYAMPSYLQTVPQAREMSRLVRDFNLNQALLHEPPVAPPDPTAAEDTVLRDPDEDDALDRAVRHLVRGEHAEALQAFAAAREETGDMPYILYWLGILHEQADHAEAAVTAFERGVEVMPECGSFHYHLGTLALHAGNVERAETHLRTARRLKPDLAPACGLLGYLRLMKGDPEEAAIFMEEAVRLDGRNGVLRLRLGQIWMAQGRVQDGLQQVRQAAEMDGAREAAAALLARLAASSEA